MIIKPANALLGPLLSGTITTLIKCIGNTGSGCTSRDTQDTLHYAVSASGITSPPTTGLLFTAVYNITGASPNTPIGFQTGCSSTSISTGLCINITSGAIGSNPETAQSAKFSNQPYFDVQAAFGAKPSLTVSRGSTDTSLALNVTSINGFAGAVSITAPVSPTGPTVTPVPSSLTITVAASLFSQLTVMVPSTTTPGNYNISATVTATSGNAPAGAPPNILLIQLIVPPPDFSLTSNPSTLIFNVTQIASSTITLSSLGNFAGNVALSVSYSSGINATLVNTSRSLTAGGSNQTTLKVASNNAGDKFNVNVTASSGTLTHIITISVIVRDFQLRVDPGTLVVQQGSTTIKTVNVEAAGGGNFRYNVTVTIAKIYVTSQSSTGSTGPSAGVTIKCNPTQVTLTASGSITPPGFSNCVVTGVLVGNYTVTVIGQAGPDSHATIFPVLVQGPDYTISAPSVKVVPVGSTVTIAAVFTRQQGLNDSITVSPLVKPVPNVMVPTVTASATTLNLNAVTPNATLFVSITASLQTPNATYILTITANSPLYQVKHAVAVTLIVVQTASAHNLAVLSVTPSTTSATVGSVINLAVFVQNLGKQAENATIVAIAGDQTVDQKTVLIQPGAIFNYTFTWKTDGFAPGAYMVGAKVLAVPGQTDTGSNLLRAATPVTLAAANTNGILQSSLLAPVVVVAAVLVAAGAVVFFYIMPKRRKVATV